MKSKLSKQQKKYIKACDSKELKQELKALFEIFNKLNNTPEYGRLFKINKIYLNKVLQESSDLNLLQDLKVLCVKYGEYEFASKFREKEKSLEKTIERSNANFLTKETIESLTNPIPKKVPNIKPIMGNLSVKENSAENKTNPDLIEKFSNEKQFILKQFEAYSILNKSASNEIPMRFCVEITDDNKEVLEKIWRDFHKDRVGYLDNCFLHSNSLHTYCYSSNVSEDNSKPIQVVSTEEFLHYIGKESLIPKKEDSKTTIEFDLPKKDVGTHTVELREDSIIFKDLQDDLIEFFNNNTNIIVNKIGEYFGMAIDIDSMTKEQCEEFHKICDNHREKYGILNEPPKSKFYTEEDMEKCFNESRFTHPIIGFKHTNFDEYIKSL